MKTQLSTWLASALLLAPGTLNAEWLERLGLVKKTDTAQPSEIDVTTLSQDQMIGGLKEALGKGVEQAVASLGMEDGFLKDLSVKIPMPAALKKVESSLRMVRQERLADEFVATMNRAAEQAVPEAATVLAQSVQQMTVTDVKAILTGTNNAATQYFRRTSETNLYERFLPIVKAATEKTGVTSAYKRMTDKAGGGAGGLATLGGSLLGKEAPDLDSYVTHKTLDGLFVKIAEQEKRIRENPAARTTDLLQQVFGAFKE
jgi:hypothetical protein